LENVLKDSPQRLSPNTCNDVKVLQKIIFWWMLIASCSETRAKLLIWMKMAS
jgi:hypothetical protein